MPNQMMNEHRTSARLEDARFLIEQGVTFEEAARRVGWTKGMLQKAMKGGDPE